MRRAAISVCLAVSSHAAIAQQGADAGAGPTARTGRLEEIVVTAQKRRQNLQKVPLAVSAFTPAALASANVTSIADLGKLMPALHVFSATGAYQPFLRGIGNPGSLTGNEPSVAVYLDGVYLLRTPIGLLQLNSIERVEVLSGPQGTLFGRNASGGLINIFTREPQQKTTLSAAVGYGNYGTYHDNLYVSTGLAPGVAIDFSAVNVNQSQGWGKNLADNRTYGYQDINSFRSKLRWDITPDTQLVVSADFTQTRDDLLTHSQFFGAPTGYQLPPYGFVPRGQFYDIQANLTPVDKDKDWGLSARLRQKLSFGTFTSTTAYRQDDSYSVFDSDFSKQNYLNAFLFGHIRQFSQELQLASNPGKYFDWIGGLYFLDSVAGYTPSRFTGLSLDAFTGGLPAVSEDFGESRTKSYAAYGQATAHLTPTTNLTVGLRFTGDDLRGDGRSVFYLIGTPAPPAQTQTGAQVFEKLTYKVAIDQHLTKDVMIYVSQSRGYKAGLYNTLPFDPKPAKPEILDATEIGFKSEFFDKRLRLNGAGFYYDFTDAQFQQFNGPTVIIINAPSARVLGAELSGQAALTEALTANFGVNYLDSRYTSFPNAQTPVRNTNTNPALGPIGGNLNGFLPFNATGNQLVRVPRWTLNVGGNYLLDTRVGAFNLSLNYSYNSGFAWDADNVLREPAYSLLDSQVKYDLPNSRWAVRAYAKNLTGTKYYVSEVQSDGARGSSALPGAPRTYGGELQYHF